MDTLAIVKRIELRLAELGMSKASFYSQTNIKSATFSQWRTGKYNPSEASLVKAAQCLGMSLEYLRDGVEPTTEEKVEKKDVLDEVDIAFYNHFKELDEEQKETVRDMVRVMRERRSKKQEK